MTYGSFVAQLIKDTEDYETVNKQLDKMGYSMGQRLIEEFLAKTGALKCTDLKETAEMIAKVCVNYNFRLDLKCFWE